MVHFFVNDFTLGNTIRGYYVLADFSERTAKNGLNYLYCILMDASGSISAVEYECNDSVDVTLRGTIVYVTGYVKKYLDNLQVKIKSMRPITRDDYSKFDLNDLITTPAIPQQYVYGKLKEAIRSIEDDDYRRLCECVLARYKFEIYTYPAGKSGHHSRCGGLAAHLLGVINSAKDSLRVYPDMNVSLLIAGAFLHDIGKIFEYKLSKYGLFGEKTEAGKLLGHIILGVQLVMKLANELHLPSEKCEKIVHIISNHHARTSCIHAMLPEALAVADADNMDCENDREYCRNSSKASYDSAA